QPATNSGFPAAGTYELGEYPDMAATVAHLHSLGFRVLTYVNPFLYKNTPAFEEAKAKGYAMKDVDGRTVQTFGLHPFEGDMLGIAELTGLHSDADAVSMVDLTNPEARSWWQGLLRKILLEEGFDGWMEDFGEYVPPEALLSDGTTAEVAHNRYP